MKLFNKLKSKRGFTLAELLIVVAIVAILAAVAFIFVKPQDISYVEYNRSAEAIATAVQNRLTEIRNSGDMEALRKLGVQAAVPESVARSAADSGEVDSAADGGYRYVFNYRMDGDNIVKDTGVAYILPFGAIEYDLAQNYYAIGFQSDTGIVGEVFYSAKPFEACTVAYLQSLQSDPELRKSKGVGYYYGKIDDKEVSFANLPTPQLTITNYEELTLSIYLPKVKQLENKQIGMLISLSDEDGEAFSKNLDLDQMAIYSTFGTPGAVDLANPTAVVMKQDIESGATYTMILDTVQKDTNVERALGKEGDVSSTPPTGDFENWATRSAAFKEGVYELGDNAVITVTVYCLYQEGDANYSEDFPVDPTFMPRAASVTFNGWFNNYGSSKVEIACGRHLQNLGKLTELRKNLKPYLPTVTDKDGDGIYEYGDYNYGLASSYTYENSHGNPATSYTDITEKFKYRDGVKHISQATQVNAIDFDCSEWYEGKNLTGEKIAFEPVCLPSGFTYMGNYLTISHLYVNAPFYAGLFGYANYANFYDMLLVNPSVTSQMPSHLAELYEMGVGALIGTSRNSRHIYNCQAYMTQEGGVYNSEKYRVTGECYVGGLIGFCEDEHIKNCSASVYTGYAKDASKTIEQQRTGVDGSVTYQNVETPIASHYVGGLVGGITGDSSFSNCYAAGFLSGEYVGGLIGLIMEDSDPSGDDYSVETCYTAGHIEYAYKEASGLLGRASELAGNAKSALNFKKNYCAVIYGEKVGDGYSWTATKQQGETTVAVPIYGTFKGDGFEWITTMENSFGDAYIKGKFDGSTFFAGAEYDKENRNYYIAQKGVTYSDSPYFSAMLKEVQKLRDAINSSSTANAASLVNDALDKITYLKKLQTLEELKLIMEDIIDEVEAETGKDINGHPYREGGFYQYSTNIYIDLDRAKVEGHNTEKGHTYSSGVTVLQALQAMYDGTYTNTAGQDVSVTMVYKGSTAAKKKLYSDYNINNYTFMNFYNFAKEAYEALLNDSTSDDEAAKRKLYALFGDPVNDAEKDIYGEARPKNADGTLVNPDLYYQNGAFYACFYDDLLHRVIDKGKDYYQTTVNDKNGELVYRYFRKLVTDKFLDILRDLSMTQERREQMLYDAKLQTLQEAYAAVDGYAAITAKWSSGRMGEYKDAVNTLATTAKTALNTLITNFQKAKVLTDLNGDIAAAVAALQDLYNFFEAHKSKKESADPGDWDVVGFDDKGNAVMGDMRKLRDPIGEYLRIVSLLTATTSSGVERALTDLSNNIGKAGTNLSSATLKEFVDAFITDVDSYLGKDWEYHDSGHKLYTAEQLRNATKGYLHGDPSEAEGTHLGFMYDYGNSHSGNPYKPEDLKNLDDSYVDLDNGIYNNVFPYLENGENTKYYPFPFVYGRALEGTSSGATALVYVLFHYGDWLTKDLWAINDPVASALDTISLQLGAMSAELTAFTSKEENQGGSVGGVTKAIDTLAGAIDTLLGEVKTADKQSLDKINQQIATWLNKNGAFTKLEEECDKFLKNENKVTIREVAGKLELYKKQLQTIQNEINGL